MSSREFLIYQADKISRLATKLGFKHSDPSWNKVITTLIQEVGASYREEWEISQLNLGDCPFCGKFTELIPELGHCEECESSGLIIGGTISCEEN